MRRCTIAPGLLAVAHREKDPPPSSNAATVLHRRHSPPLLPRTLELAQLEVTRSAYRTADAHRQPAAIACCRDNGMVACGRPRHVEASGVGLLRPGEDGAIAIDCGLQPTRLGGRLLHVPPVLGPYRRRCGRVRISWHHLNRLPEITHPTPLLQSLSAPILPSVPSCRVAQLFDLRLHGTVRLLEMFKLGGHSKLFL